MSTNVVMNSLPTSLGSLATTLPRRERGDLSQVLFLSSSWVSAVVTVEQLLFQFLSDRSSLLMIVVSRDTKVIFSKEADNYLVMSFTKCQINMQSQDLKKMSSKTQDNWIKSNHCHFVCSQFVWLKPQWTGLGLLPLFTPAPHLFMSCCSSRASLLLGFYSYHKFNSRQCAVTSFGCDQRKENGGNTWYLIANKDLLLLLRFYHPCSFSPPLTHGNLKNKNQKNTTHRSDLK